MKNNLFHHLPTVNLVKHAAHRQVPIEACSCAIRNNLYHTRPLLLMIICNDPSNGSKPILYTSAYPSPNKHTQHARVKCTNVLTDLDLFLCLGCFHITLLSSSVAQTMAMNPERVIPAQHQATKPKTAQPLKARRSVGAKAMQKTARVVAQETQQPGALNQQPSQARPNVKERHNNKGVNRRQHTLRDCSMGTRI